MPWKNGGGSTTELLVEPAGATLQTGFRWRLSMAALETSGPFSRFEGHDRTMVPEGAPCCRPWNPGPFPGNGKPRGC